MTDNITDHMTRNAYMVVIYRDGTHTSRLFVSVRKLSEYLLSMYQVYEFSYKYIKFILKNHKKYILFDSFTTKITLERVSLHV